MANLKTRPPEMVLENKKKRQKGGYNIFCTALKYHIQFTDAQKGSENVSMVEIYSKNLEHDNSDRFTCMILDLFLFWNLTNNVCTYENKYTCAWSIKCRKKEKVKY